MLVLDVAQTQMPRYAAEDLRRLPPSFFAPAASTPAYGEVLTAVVTKMETLTSTMAEISNRLQPTAKSLARMPTVTYQSTNAQNAGMAEFAGSTALRNPSADTEVKVNTPATAAVGDVQQVLHPSWSNLAANLPVNDAALEHKRMRVGVKVRDCRMKTVPRQFSLVA